MNIELRSNVRSYTLECGCHFEHSLKAGIPSFEVVLTCADHANWTHKELEALSSPPPVSFMDEADAAGNYTPPSTTYASNQQRDAEWRTKFKNAVETAAKMAGLRPHSLELPTGGPAQFAFVDILMAFFNHGLTQCVKPEIENTQTMEEHATVQVRSGTSPIYMHTPSFDGKTHHYVCVDCGCEHGHGHHKFCKFHVG